MNSNSEEIKEVDVAQAKQLIQQKDTIIIDIRSELDYEAGNIKGSRHLSPDTFEKFVKNTDQTKTILCYCYHGNSSLGVCAALKDHGFLNPISLKGGFSAWQNQT